jgi:hypothetical protein
MTGLAFGRLKVVRSSPGPRMRSRFDTWMVSLGPPTDLRVLAMPGVLAFQNAPALVGP